MTERLFFDSDCISAFLWVNGQSLLSRLYSQKIVIPRQVYTEISNPCVPHLKERVDSVVASGDAVIYDMDVGTSEYRLYIQMTTAPQTGYKIIGSGEAASIALAKEKNGILASNNMKDIAQYVNGFGLRHITTGGILREAFEKKMISLDEGESIWRAMIKKKRKLGASTFSEYLHSF